MCDKAACDRQSKCSYLLKKLQDFFHHDKIVDGGDSIKQLTQSISVVSGCDEGQAYFKAVQQYVVQTMIGLLEGSGDHFIFLPPEGDLFNESNALYLLSLLAFQTGDTACLEEIASCYQGYSSDGYLMISVGAMLIQRMKYRPSEKCFLSALSYFKHKQNHLGTVVATVNLAVFHKICGDYRKAQSYCNAAVRLCLDFTRTPATDVHLKVVFRLAILSQELKDYNSNHDILRVAMKFDIDQISDAFVAKYMKQLMTLQLKGLEGEQIKHDKLEELALQLNAVDVFPKTQPLNADFIVTFMMLAEMYFSIKCFKEARQLIHKLESTFLHAYGGNCPLFGFLQYKIGHFKFIYGDASEAQSNLIKAEQIFTHYFGRDHHMVGSCKSLQGACALQKGNQKEACHCLKEARIIFEEINHHHPKVGKILLKVADLESEAGNFENAKLAIEEALEMFISSCGKVSLQTALAYLQGASILKWKGKFMQSALEKVKKTSDIFILHGLHHDHPNVAFCRCLQSQLLHSLGQVKEAEEEFLFVHHQLSSQDDLSMKTCNSDQKLDLHAQTNWEPDSDMLKIGPSVDLSQTEDTKSLSFTAHSEDNIVTDVCVDLLECILRNRQLSLEVQLSHINNGLYTTDGTEEHVNSLLSPGSASSLNCLPLSQYDATNGKQEFMQKALPSLKNVYGETCSGKETGNVSDTSSTSQAIFFSSHYHESAVVKSNCEEGWIEKYHPSSETKDNLPPNEIPQEMCSVQSIEACSNKDELREDHRMEFDQSSEFPLATAGRENGKGTITNGNLINELQEEVMFYQDQCHELREELIKLKEKLKLCEEEKQGLQAEVGRQLFLESKERRCSKKVYQPLRKHASGTSEPVGIRGASHDFSGFLLQQRLQEISHSLSELELNRIKNLVRPILDNCRLARIREFSKLLEELERRGEFSCSFVRDLLERIHRFDLVEKLAEPFHNGEESCIKKSYSPQESKQLNEVVESVSGVKSKQCDEVEEGKEIFDNTEVDEEDEVCNNSNVNSFNSDSERASVTFPAKNVNESSFVGGVDLSEERYDSASSLSQSSDVPSIGLESRERSWSPSFTSKQFDGEKLKGACAANGERDREGAHDSSFPHGAETQFYFNHHFNDTVYGAANLPDRAQDSLKQEYLTSVNQDSLPNGDTTQRQNVSGARFIVQKDTATDHSDSRVSNQSNEWEHLGARLQDGTFPSLPRDELFHSGITGSGLTSDFMQPTGFQIGALNTLDSSLSLHDYALGTREPQIPPDGYFTSLQINQPIHFNGSGFTSDLTGSTRSELTHSATGTHRDSDFSGSASMLPSTRNSGLSVSSSVCKQTYGFPPDASSTSSSGARVNGSDGRLFSESESSRVSQLLSVTTGRDGLNTSEEVNSSSNAMNASDDHLASGHYREGSRAYNSSSSHMISGTDTGESQSGQTEDLVTNRNYGTESVESTDNSLLELEQRVEEACAMVERVLREREEREEFGREIERKEHEIQAERARKKREREARELEEARGWPQQQEPVTGTHRNSDFRGSASMLPSTRNSELLNPSVANNFVPFTRLQGGTFPSLQIDEVFRSGYTGSVLTSDLMTTGLQTSVMSGADQHFGQLGGSMMNTNSVTELVNSPNNTLHELEQGADEGCALVEIVSREREEREQFGQEIERPECEIGAERAQQRERDERELRVAIREQQCQEAMRRPSLCQEEREIGAEGVQQTTVCVVRSLNANNNSCQALAEDIEAATARIQARWPWFGRWWSWFGRWWSWFGRWWCTCAGGLRDHDFGVICSNCFKYKYCGPCRVKPQSDQNECCICLEDVSSGCMILPCSHKVHRECAIAMIQNGIRMCPVCRYPLYSPAPE